jgi:hypothetical protein
VAFFSRSSEDASTDLAGFLRLLSADALAPCLKARDIITLTEFVVRRNEINWQDLSQVNIVAVYVLSFAEIQEVFKI